MAATERQILWLKALPEYGYMKRRLGPFDPTKDYLGAEGDWKSKFIPCVILGADINVAGFCHDYWYSVGGTKTDKDKADGLFLLDIIRCINWERMGWWKRPRAYLRAVGYCLAVQKFGDDAFNFKEDD